MNQKYCHLQKQFYQQHDDMTHALEGHRIQVFFSLVRGHPARNELHTNQWGIWTEQGQYLLHCPEHGSFTLKPTACNWYTIMERTNTDEIVLHPFMTGQHIRHVAPCFDLYKMGIGGVTLVLDSVSISACSDGLWINRPSPRYLYAAQTHAMLRALMRYSSKYYGLSDWSSTEQNVVIDNLGRMMGYDRLRMSNNLKPNEHEIHWIINEINSGVNEPISSTVSSVLNDFAQTCCIHSPFCGVCPIKEWCYYPNKTQ